MVLRIMENTTSQLNENLKETIVKQYKAESGEDFKDQKTGLPLLTTQKLEDLLHSALEKKKEDAIIRDEDTGFIEDLQILWIVLFNDVSSTTEDNKGSLFSSEDVNKVFTALMLYLRLNTGFEYNVSYLKHQMNMLLLNLMDIRCHFDYLIEDLNKIIQSSEYNSCKAYLVDGFLKLVVNPQKLSYEVTLNLNGVRTVFSLTKDRYTLQIFDVDEESGSESLLSSEWRRRK